MMLIAICGLLSICLVVLLIWSLKLQTSEKRLSAALASSQQDLREAEHRFTSERNAILDATRQAGAEMRDQLDQEVRKLQNEAEKIRAHYESETLKIHNAADTQLRKALRDVQALKQYEGLVDAERKAKEMLDEALKHASELKAEAEAIISSCRASVQSHEAEARATAEKLVQQAQAALAQAMKDAARIRLEAETNAEQIGGDAYRALLEKNALERAAVAIKNVIEGYGDRYVVSAHSFLDNLAEDFRHEAAGMSLRLATQHKRRMMGDDQAAVCDYVEDYRRQTAVRFVLDAFESKVEAILARAKHDNFGVLAQEIKDSFALVNHNGEAFRNARILPSFLDACLEELKWAVAVHELRRLEREEQRRINEQIREEQRARREYEKALRDTAREEEIIRRAMVEAQRQAQAASTEQKAQYEQQLRDLSERLRVAEERGQRALSMAQQTRRGYVYIISNIGSLGENIYKIGLTRRLEPMDRIYELSDASVPFDFDVHAMIFSEDAPALETRLHKVFVELQVNKVNHRREFFRIDLARIRQELEGLDYQVKWTMKAQAAEYRETLAIEEAIKANPALREQWIQRQLELDPVDYITEDETELLARS